MPDHPQRSAEELLEDVRWLRRFARRLVRDGVEAEDVTQDAWLSVLEHAPRGIDRAGLRAWLARVARSVAAHRWQASSLRRHHEARRAREVPPAEGRAAGALDELQRQHELVGHVLALEEPYRTALVLRFRRELSYAEMARELALAEPAVRKRVSRGLALLRARLAEESGAEWRAHYALLAGTPPAARVLPWLVAAAALAAVYALGRAREAGSAESGPALGAWSAAAPLGAPAAPAPDARAALAELEPFLGCDGFAADVEGLSLRQSASFPEGDGLGSTEALIGWDPRARRLAFVAFHSALEELECSSEGTLALDDDGALLLERTSFEPGGARRRQRERLRLAGPLRLQHDIEIEADDGAWELPFGLLPPRAFAGVLGAEASGATPRLRAERHDDADERELAGIEPFLGSWSPLEGDSGETWELAWGLPGRTLHLRETRATPDGREVVAHGLAGWHHGERALVFLEFHAGGRNRGRCGLDAEGAFWREFEAVGVDGAVREHRQRFVLEKPDRWRLEREVRVPGSAWERLASLRGRRDE